MYRKRKSGFTLLELIVVMAVIAILVAMGVPRFIGYQKDARVSAMQSDCKVLEGACDICAVYDEPFTGDSVGELSGGLVSFLGDGDVEVRSISEHAVKSHVRSLSNDISDYGYVMSGVYADRVVHLDGVLDRKDVRHFCIGGYQSMHSTHVIDETFGEGLPEYSNGWAMYKLSRRWEKDTDSIKAIHDHEGEYIESGRNLYDAYVAVDSENSSVLRMHNSLEASFDLVIKNDNSSIVALLLYFKAQIDDEAIGGDSDGYDYNKGIQCDDVASYVLGFVVAENSMWLACNDVEAIEGEELNWAEILDSEDWIGHECIEDIPYDNIKLDVCIKGENVECLVKDNNNNTAECEFSLGNRISGSGAVGFGAFSFNDNASGDFIELCHVKFKIS